MGVSINYLTDIKLINVSEELDDETFDKYCDTYYLTSANNGSFKNYGYHNDLLLGAWYSYDDTVEIFSTSYGHYNQIRDNISTAVLGYSARAVWHNLQDFQDAPFIEIINFTDCEGVLGADTVKKLSADFIEYNDDFMSVADDEYLPYYQILSRGFQDAASKNAIITYS